MEVKHISFNPNYSGLVFAMGYPSTLSGICSAQERDGWALVRIVYHSDYEAVAVFERD